MGRHNAVTPVVLTYFYFIVLQTGFEPAARLLTSHGIEGPAT